MASDPNSGMTCLSLDGGLVGYELSPRDAARALEEAALSIDGLATAHTKLGSALAETGAALQAEQYAKRDAEFVAWYSGLDLLQKESRTAALKIAFNAGWAARKRAVDYALDTPPVVVGEANHDK